MTRKLLFVFGLVQLGFLDLCVGPLIGSVGTLLAYLVVAELPLPVLVLGALCSLCTVLPDVDLLWCREGHRSSFMHAPWLIVPLVAFLTYTFGGTIVGTCLTLSVLWHFVHDTIIGKIQWIPGLLAVGLWQPTNVKSLREVIERHWWIPTIWSAFEIFGGGIALVTAASIGAPSYMPMAVALSLCMFAATLAVWIGKPRPVTA